MKSAWEFIKANRATAGALLGFVSGLVAGKYPAIAQLLDQAAKALGAGQ